MWHFCFKGRIKKKCALICASNFLVFINNNNKKKMLSRKCIPPKYDNIQYIGNGAYSDVYLARKENQSVALKVCAIVELNGGIPATIIREISFLRSLEHPNIVKLLDVCFGGTKHVIMELEYLETDLGKALQHGKTLPVKEIMRQLLVAVDFCHSNNVLHRDIKPQNVLLDEYPLRVCLADFGMAKTQLSALKQDKDQEVVTLWYRAPEALLNTGSYTSALDIWSVGCVFGELLLHRPLFATGSAKKQLKMIQKQQQSLLSTRFRQYKEEWKVIERMLCMDAKVRITAREALSFAYFN
jgi:serine/threonine protein kinase